MSDSLITPKFRVSFPKVFTPQLNELSGKEEYSLVAIFEKEADLSELKEAAKNAMQAKWGPDKSKWPKEIRTPFKDQASNDKINLYGEGAIFMNLKSKQRPSIVDMDVQPIMQQEEFYAGCWARASVRAYAYDQKVNRGVAFGLVNLQKIADDEPLSGRPKAEDEFSPVTEKAKVTGTSSPAEDLFN